MIIRLKVFEQTLTVINTKSVPRMGSKDYLILQFSFSSDWNDLSKLCYLQKGEISQPIDIVDGLAEVPEWFTQQESFDVTLFGKAGNKEVPTNVVSMRLEKSNTLWENDAPEPQPSWIGKIIDLNNHPPVPGDNGFWLIWDTDNGAYAESDLPLPTDDRAQSDYEQNDSSQADYIKNRTHYKEIIHQEKVDLLPATEIDFSSIGETGYIQPEPLNIQAGDTVKVLWGSQEYECVAQSVAKFDPEGVTGFPADCIVFGNLYYAFEGANPDSKDIPFVVIANYAPDGDGFSSGCWIVLASELTNPITVNIFTGGDKVVYHKLDVNYLPISDSNISKDENNIVTSKPLINYLIANRPDWSVSDEDDPRYIKSRPFYRYLISVTHTPIDRSIILDENGVYTSQEQLYDFNDISDNSYGDINLTVYWHDGTYNCKLRSIYTEWINEQGNLQNYYYFVFGNVSDIADYDDTAPFLIYADFNPETHKIDETYIKAYDGFTGEMTLQVDAEYRYWNYNTLDNRYLRLTKSVLENDDNPVTSGAVYEAIQAAIGNALGGSY